MDWQHPVWPSNRLPWPCKALGCAQARCAGGAARVKSEATGVHTNPQTETETDRDRDTHGHTKTDRDREKQTKTYRETEKDRQRNWGI